MDVRNSVVVVTGAASGLGLATATHFRERGATVVGIDLLGQVEKLAGSNEGENSIGAQLNLATDITDVDAVREALQLATQRGPLRAVVHCAGVLASERILSKQGVHDLARFARIIQINVVGSFNVLACAAEVMASTSPIDGDGQRGVIVLTSSIAAYEGQVGQVAYASSKAGVSGMVLPAARDLARTGIRVNAIAPGVVETPMLAEVTPEFKAHLRAEIPFPSRLATPTEFAQLAGMIVEHDYLNGEVIRLDAALRMGPR